ncbi:uncharacterized protein LOC113520744 isoform X1 [Galleria mellonella]|uniref:Uncharacterized protein LOC113520744 isoform X1 n=2 Tax=Galleriinae TaxID=40082 RepID=A0ABM3M8C1_GALME|nr:uncharacterized protein LOC113520744 isoform X1 [Galleria mellonella]
MQTHGNLTASYLWQPGEFARRMLGERPSPVPPTRDLWPPPQQPLSISTLHITYLQDEPIPRRAATLPPQTYVPLSMPDEPEHSRPRLCTVGTNTDPPETILNKLKRLTRRQGDVPVGQPPPGRLTAVPRETAIDGKEENAALRALNEIKKAISGAKYRITPGVETVESPKIVYDMSKPGDRMTTTFGARESHKWCSIPSKASCSRRLRAMGGWCRQHPRRPPRRQSQPPSLQITQVIALICGLLVVILMVLGLASADWLMAAGWRQGLFMHCIDPEAPTPLPFDITAQPGCYAARPAPYIKAAAGLCVATLAADVCGALLTGLGLRAADHRTKFRYYRFAVLAMALALMCILIALVIYPVCFAAELNLGNRSVWEFGWAYGVGWGAAIFLFGAVVLLLCDKESEELYYKERKVVQAEGGGRP